MPTTGRGEGSNVPVTGVALRIANGQDARNSTITVEPQTYTTKGPRQRSGEVPVEQPVAHLCLVAQWSSQRPPGQPHEFGTVTGTVIAIDAGVDAVYG